MKPLRLARVILPALLLLASTCTEWNDMPQAPCGGGARIFGVVTGGSGPISGMEVRAIATSGAALVEVETEADGTYELLVPTGRYSVSVTSASSYREFYYSASGPKSDSDDADTLDVTEGDAGTRADIRLGGLLLILRIPPGYELSGEYGESRIECRLEEPTRNRTLDYMRSSVRDSVVIVDAPTLVPGRYVLGLYRSSNEAMWFPPTFDRAQAEVVEIKSEETTFLSCTLPLPATVRGRVTGAWTLLDTGYRPVRIYGADSTLSISVADIADDWSFEALVMGRGEVRVRLSLSGAAMWLGGTSFATASRFQIESETGVDIGEIPTCGVRCTIVETPGGEDEWWSVSANDDQGRHLASASSEVGDACFVPLPRPMTCRLQIDGETNRRWKSQWFDRQIDFEHATPVTVSGASELAEVSIRLEKGGSIAGRVVYQDGSPAIDVQVRVRSGDGANSYTWTDSPGGTFALGGLSDGQFELRAGTRWGYYFYYPGTAFPDSAELIPIVDASDVVDLLFRLPVSGAGKPVFLGGQSCKPCHQTEEQGQIYAIWSASAHSRAYSDLGPTQQQDDLCLSCHTTGFGCELAPGRDRTSMRGVQCEACHGPGSEYKAMSVMRDPTEARRLGLIMPDEDDCRVCHRGSLPRECWGGGGTSPAFDYSLASARIAHRIPG